MSVPQNVVQTVAHFMLTKNLTRLCTNTAI